MFLNNSTYVWAWQRFILKLFLRTNNRFFYVVLLMTLVVLWQILISFSETISDFSRLPDTILFQRTVGIREVTREVGELFEVNWPWESCPRTSVNFCTIMITIYPIHDWHMSWLLQHEPFLIQIVSINIFYTPAEPVIKNIFFSYFNIFIFQKPNARMNKLGMTTNHFLSDLKMKVIFLRIKR